MSISCFKSCQFCQERFPGCHSTCPKYLEERAAYDAIKAKAAENKIPVLTTYDFDEIAYSHCKNHKRRPR